MAGLPIDRGWSWMVLVGAFMSSFFVVGGFKSMGIIFVHVLERYNARQGLTAWMMGMMSFGLAFFSPIATSLGIRYTHRVAVMIGGAVMSLGFLLAAYSPNIYSVVILLGTFVGPTLWNGLPEEKRNPSTLEIFLSGLKTQLFTVTGFGNGFLYTPSMIMVGQYFDRHCSLAMGLAAAGGSFGQLVIPFLIRFLLDHYDYQGCMLIYSAFVMHAIVGGALLRPQTFYTTRVSKQTVETADTKDSVPEVHTPSHSINSLVFNAQIQDSVMSTPMNAVEAPKAAHSLENIEETILHKGPDERGDNLDNSDLEFPSVNVRMTPRYRSNGSIQMVSEDIDDKPTKAFYNSTGSIAMLSQSSDKVEESESQQTSSNMENIEHTSQNCCRQCLNGVIMPFKNLFDRELFSTYMFWLYFFAVCLSNAGYIDQFLFIPPYADEIGISKMHSAGILSASGIADLIGRVSGGVLNNFRKIPIHIFISSTLFTTAFVILICLIFPCYASLMAHGVVLGLIGGMYIALFPVMLIELVGGVKFPRAFAFTMMGVGFVNLPLPPIFGLISEARNSYAVPYVILNIMMLIGGLLYILVPCAQEGDRQHQQAGTGVEEVHEEQEIQ